ncbi:hypothetical protein BK022_05725 [Methylorubrum extorquens]|uniref:Uncharacterized protein n=1 Tax=Methylorubrum extorquens TaxID=408 RepID=A0A1S1P7Y9_METEX|nr:hypothetical protein BK022_05725 [Methylorubrum extorquens]
MRIICAAWQQRIPISGDPANGTGQVGGFVQLAQLDRSAASSVIAHRWPDAIGAQPAPCETRKSPSLLRLAKERCRPRHEIYSPSARHAVAEVSWALDPGTISTSR